MPKLLPPTEYTGVCYCHDREVTGKPSLANPDPMFIDAWPRGQRVLARKIIADHADPDGNLGHWIPSEPTKRSPADGRKHP